MTELIIEVCLALALVIAGAFVAHRHDAKELDAAKADNATLTQANTQLVAQRGIDQATLASLAQTKAVLAQSHATATASLAKAAAGAPSWAATVVPHEVQDALKP